jgi:2-dehydropantoate 2-reductase
MKIEAYLFFNGEAKQAIAFYQHALGAKLEELRRYADCPDPVPAEYWPPGGGQSLLHASLLIDDQRIMLSDGIPLDGGGFRGPSARWGHGSPRNFKYGETRSCCGNFGAGFAAGASVQLASGLDGLNVQEKSMRVLMVGAGAVGQVFGAHLQRGGAQVGVYVRPARRAWAQRSHAMWRVRGRGRRESGAFRADAVLCDVSEVNPTQWDQLWLAVPSPAVREEALQPLLRAFAGRPVVTTTPGWRDQAHLAACCGADGLAQVMTGYLAWFGALAGDKRESQGASAEALRYWFPPMSPSLISGPQHVVAPALQALKRGALPIRRVRDARVVAGFASAAMMPALAALESATWGFGALRQSGRLAVAAQAGREAMLALAKSEHLKSPLWRSALRGGTLSVLLRVAAMAAPLPVEAFLALHFTKVGAQTRDMLDTYRVLAAEAGLPHGALDQCRNWLRACVR